DPAAEPETEVLARLRPWWVVYHVFGLVAYVTALGLFGSAYWLASSLGVDVARFVAGLVDWSALGWAGVAALGLVVGGVVGAFGAAANFFATHWRFELARVRTGGRSYLRTRRGLFST